MSGEQHDVPAGAAPECCSCGHILVPGKSQTMTEIEKRCGSSYKCTAEECGCRQCILVRHCCAFNGMLRSMGFPPPRYSS